MNTTWQLVASMILVVVGSSKAGVPDEGTRETNKPPASTTGNQPEKSNGTKKSATPATKKATPSKAPPQKNAASKGAPKKAPMKKATPKKTPPANGNTKLAALPKILNPSMSEGTDKPNQWTRDNAYHGKIAVARDTKIFVSGNASLRISSLDGPAKGDTKQIIEWKTGGRFHLEGKIRTEGNTTAYLEVISFTDNWQYLGHTVIGSANASAGWKTVGNDFTLLPQSHCFAVTLTMDGDGSAWLDDVVLTAPQGKSPNTPRDRPVAAMNAWSPAEGFFADMPNTWYQLHEVFLAQSRISPATVVFWGDEFVQRWPKPLWAKHFVPLQSANRGIAGDGAPQVLWRIRNGELLASRPRVVVLFVGVANLWPGYTAEHTARGIFTMVREVQEKSPTSKVLILGLPPILENRDLARVWIQSVNKLLAHGADGTNVYFLDVFPLLLDEQGRQKANFFAEDRIHWEIPAYELLSGVIEKTLRELLK